MTYAAGVTLTLWCNLTVNFIFVLHAMLGSGLWCSIKKVSINNSITFSYHLSFILSLILQLIELDMEIKAGTWKKIGLLVSALMACHFIPVIMNQYNQSTKANEKRKTDM